MMKLEPGRKFNMLTIESFAEYRFVGRIKRGFYNCICECGKKCIIRDTALTRKNGQKSCGCYRKLSVKKAQYISASNRFLGGNEAAKRAVYNYYVSNAKRRNHEFQLEKDKFYKMVQSNCYYCNKIPSSEQKIYRSKVDRIYESYFYNGLDRVDSNKGYTLDNIVTCCKDCNRAKQDLSQNDFYQLIKRIYQFRNLDG